MVTWRTLFDHRRRHPKYGFYNGEFCSFPAWKKMGASHSFYKTHNKTILNLYHGFLIVQHYLSTQSFAFTKSWHSFHHATSHFSISLQRRWPPILNHLLLVFEMHMHIFRKSGYLSITNLQPCVNETKNTEKKLENSRKRKRAYQK